MWSLITINPHLTNTIHFRVPMKLTTESSQNLLFEISIQIREKRLSPRRAPRRSLLPLSPKRTQVRLKSLLYLVWLTPDPFRTHGRPSVQECRLRLKRPPSSSRTLAWHLPFKSSTACRALAPTASFRGPLCFASLSAKKYGTPYFSVSKPNFKIFPKLLPKPRGASPSPKSWRVTVHPRYPAWSICGCWLEKIHIADALLRHFGSLKALSRASFKELRQFLPKGKAEAVMAALSISNVADAEHALSAPLNNAEAIYRANLDMKGFHQEVVRVVLLDAQLPLHHEGRYCERNRE